MNQNFQVKRFNKNSTSCIIVIGFFIFLFSPIVSFADTNTCTGSPGSSCTVNDSVDISAAVSGGTNGGNPGGGGGGGGGYGSSTSITFSGLAYPLSRVILLQDGQEVVNTISGPDAQFTIIVSDLSSGTYTFSIVGEDSNGLRSTLFTIPILITAGVATNISGIFIAPTIEINKQQVKRGETLTIFGKTVPNAMVSIEVHSTTEVFDSVTSSSNGAYLYNLNTSPLEYGNHSTKSKSSLPATSSNETSSYSKSLSFTVGDKTIIEKESCITRGDINGDCHVNLIDFSIMAYWYHRIAPPKNFCIRNYFPKSKSKLRYWRRVFFTNNSCKSKYNDKCTFRGYIVR